MTQQPEQLPSPMQLAALIWRDRIRVAMIAGSIFAVVLVYCLFKGNVWQATQSLIIREPASADRSVRGKFLHSDDRKTVQAAIVALAHHGETIKKALVAIGPGVGRAQGKSWPSPAEIRTARESIEVSPPNGSEYGKTEIFFLSSKHRDAQRAVQLAKAVSLVVQRQYQLIRDEQAKDMTRELEVAVKNAQEQLAKDSVLLSEMEVELGADLGELRMLDSQSSSVSDLRQNLLSLETERRVAERDVRSHDTLLGILQDAENSPSKVLATPNDLLTLQPSLKRLKEGVVDAQLRTAQLLGKRTAEHPEVLAAKETEQAAFQQLKKELTNAVKGLAVDKKLALARVSSLNEQVADLKSRLSRVAAIRAKYAQQNAIVRSDTEYLDRARRELAEVKATALAMSPARLLQLVDEPELGDRPLGPSRSMLCAGGFIASLLCASGVSLVLQGAHAPLLANFHSLASPHSTSDDEPSRLAFPWNPQETAAGANGWTSHGDAPWQNAGDHAAAASLNLKGSNRHPMEEARSASHGRSSLTYGHGALNSVVLQVNAAGCITC